MYRIENQAKFLSRELPVTLCQAQEMISFYYGCDNWKNLKNCVKKQLHRLLIKGSMTTLMVSV